MIVVLGTGESGLGAALLAARHGLDVFVSEYSAIAPETRQILEDNNIRFEENGHTLDILAHASEVIKSPGIAESTQIIRFFRDKNIPVISEVEFAYRYCPGTIIGITGSNGKTTTTGLIGHLLQHAGKNTMICGNIGFGFAKALLEPAADFYVVELSSFQLDDIVKFHPNVAVITNITPDHLDRYGFSLQSYAEAKFNISLNQQKGDTFIYYARDQVVSVMTLLRVGHEVTKIGVDTPQFPKVILDSRGNTYRINNAALKGVHNALNALMAVEAVYGYVNDPAVLQSGLDTFVNASHRLELIASINNIAFIDDSKATNVDAVKYALDAFEEPIIWIAGGKDKGNDYAPIHDLVRKKVKYLVCLTAYPEKLISEFGDLFEDIYVTESTEEAVAKAYEKATGKDVVLLSPACASFDLFDNYEQRGDEFKKAVFELKNKMEQ